VSDAPASRRAALVLFWLVPLFFACNMLVARWNAGAIPSVALAFWRWTVTLLILLPFVAERLWRGRDEIRAEWRTFLWLGFLGMGVCGAPVYEAGITTTAMNIGLIYAASPVLIVLVAWLRHGDPVGARQALGIAVCLAGTLWIVLRGEPANVLRLEFVPGDLMIVAAMVAWSIYSVAIRHTPTKLDATTRLVAICTGGVLVNLPFYVAESVYVAVLPLEWKTAGIILFLALAPGIGSYLSYSVIVAALGAGTASLIMYLTPLYGAALAWLLLGERLADFHLVGLALLLPGLWLGTRRQAK
jgi:drug/metabolite transporter (DMT)-like permease